VFNLKKLLFGGAGTPANLAPDVAAGVAQWRALPAVSGDDVHFHARYVVVDVSVAGLDVREDALLGIAAVGMSRGALIKPGEVLAIDLSAGAEDDGEAFDRQLLAFLQFAGKCPLVSYRVPFVSSFLQKAFNERLGVDFHPEWIDLAWVLTDLFKETSETVVPRDTWLETFGIEGSAGRDPVVNALALARLLQVALPRASERGADTPAKIIEISKARRFLRQGA